MNLSLPRLEVMDAQRFDPSKGRNFSNPTISIVAPSVHSEEPGIPQITILSAESNEILTMNQSSPANDGSKLSTPVVEPAIFTYKSDSTSVDVFERHDYTTTRTIIRPASIARLPFISFFFRPLSPIPSVTPHSNSFLGAIFANFNCMCCADAFEEDLDFVPQQRENNLAAVPPEIKVKVTQDQTVFYEEKLKDAIRAILSECPPPIVSCVGYVH